MNYHHACTRVTLYCTLNASATFTGHLIYFVINIQKEGT